LDKSFLVKLVRVFMKKNYRTVLTVVPVLCNVLLNIYVSLSVKNLF